MAEKTAPIHAFDFLDSAPKTPLPSVVACFGTDDFLRQSSIRHLVNASGLEPESVRSYDGDEADWRDVHDQLATRSLFDDFGIRAALVRGADKFVSKNRDSLERWIDGKATDCCLVLDIQTLAANTKIYQLVSKNGLLVKCTPPQKASYGNPPDDKAIQKWVSEWGKKRHALELSGAQCVLIVERIGGVCGLIDCELAKLALFADNKGRVADERVAELVGGWRTQTAWEVADAIADGKTSVALEQIEKLYHAGQAPIGLAAQIGWSLRRFGVAAQIVEQYEREGTKLSLTAALEKAGFNRFDLAKAETRLRRIGRVRAKQLLNQLVHLELQLKGSHSSDHRARFALESLVHSLR